MKYYLIAGEASGDLHGSNLIRQIKLRDPEAEFRGWGGDLMEEQGTELVKHYRDLAFMGFIEVVMNLSTILRNIKLCKKDLIDYQPDALILIDYPGFNLRIAEFAKKSGIRVFYYISPQVWAWKASRVKLIRRVVEKMFVILPFEADFYKKYDYEVEFVGHPLLDAIADYESTKQAPEEFKLENELDDRPIVAVLPGSRKQEISRMLPVMLEVRTHFPNHQFVVAGAPSQPKSFYDQWLAGTDVKLLQARTYDLLQQAKAALVTSGTATLETALFKVPEVVCYSGSAISYQIARRLVSIKYISLVNLIMDQEIVRELIQ